MSVNAQTTASEELIKNGIKLYDEDKYDEAVNVFKLVNENDSNYFWMLSEIALTYIQKEKFDSAVYYADKGLAQPTKFRQHLMGSKATALDYSGHPDQAIEVYKEAIRLYPYSYNLYYNMGVTYLKKNDYQGAVRCFQESLRCNPFHASSHMRLGMIMAREGLFTRALLSLETFLALEPQSSRSNEILVYVENICSNYLDTAKGDFIEQFTDNDFFNQADNLIKSKVVLNDKYKPVIDFNANLVKQTSLLFETLPFDSAQDDFWVQLYFPFFKAVKDGGFIEPFLYTILRSSGKDQVQKYIKKNQKTLDEFYKTGPDLARIRRTRTININNEILLLAASYYDDGSLNTLGNKSPEGKEQGYWQYFYPNGELKSEGAMINGQRDGKWKYYSDNGLPGAVENFRNGKLNGEYKSYHSTGKVAVRAVYADDKVNGEVTWFNLSGTPVKVLTYENDIISGEAKTFYTSSKLKEHYYFKNNKIEGEHLTFLPDEQPGIKAYFKNGEPDGDYIEYFSDGKPSVKGLYKEGKEEGEWKYYYPDGNLKKVQNFSAGITAGIYKEYNYKGLLQIERTYDSSGQLQGKTIYYDTKGRKIIEEEYKNNIIVGITSDFGNSGKPSFFGNPSGTFVFTSFDHDGKIRSKGNYVKGKPDGLWTFYYKNGNPKQSINYKDGKYEGELQNFHPDGKLMNITTYRNGVAEGRYVEYSKDGTVLKTGFYLDNNMNNIWNYYLANGEPESSCYFLNGDLNGWYTNFAVDGRMKARDKYLEGELIEEQQFSPDGIIVNNVDFLEINSYQIKNSDDYVLAVGQVAGGSLNGPFKWYYPGGSISTQMELTDGIREGEYTQYYPDGKVMIEGHTEKGEKNGLWKRFDEDGHLSSEERYFQGMKDSVHIYYYDDGKVRMTETYFEDKPDGNFTMYDNSGALMVRLIYSEGELTGYQYMKDGALIDTIPVTRGDQTIIAYYDNGGKSFEQYFKDFTEEGPQIKYYSNGKIMQLREYKNGMLEGKCEKYYPDGKPEALFSCDNGLYEGEFISYRKSGGIKEITNYLHDQQNGETRYFGINGELLKTENYWSGSFIGYNQK